MGRSPARQNQHPERREARAPFLVGGNDNIESNCIHQRCALGFGLEAMPSLQLYNSIIQVYDTIGYNTYSDPTHTVISI